MSKLTKFIRHPYRFFSDMARKRRLAEEAAGEDDGRIPTYLFGLSPWKEFMTFWFPERRMIHIGRKVSQKEFNANWAPRILASSASEIMIWGFKASEYLHRFVEKHDLKLWYVEDGFIRSIGLGASKTPPFSLALDSRTPYFNARAESDLEHLLQSYDFTSDPTLLPRAEALMRKILDTGLSKYNLSSPVDIREIYGPKTSRRILVIGQVEDDASIACGCERAVTNNELVELAHIENPGCQIIYKPHPDVLHQKRQALSDPNEVRHLCKILADVPLSQAFETVDQVYTITSLAGFEALMRGIPVTTVGCPFYSGWGLTDDRQRNERRTRKLGVLEVFAASYILYPKYFDPIHRVSLTPEEAVERLVSLRAGKGEESPCGK